MMSKCNKLFSKLPAILLCLAPVTLTTSCGPEIDCEIGERYCENNVSRTCVYGKWVDVPCEGASPVCDSKHGCVKAQSICGNGAIDIGEACDRDNLANRTCASLIPGSTGTLRCLDTCQYDTSGCQAPEKECTVIGEKRCNGNELQQCIDYEWGNSLNCASINQMICDPITLSCINGCQGEPRCSDDDKSMISCKSGEEFIEPCEPGKRCSLNGNGQPECLPAN